MIAWLNKLNGVSELVQVFGILNDTLRDSKIERPIYRDEDLQYAGRTNRRQKKIVRAECYFLKVNKL